MSVPLAEPAPWTLERAIRRARSSPVAGLRHTHAKPCTGCLVPGLPNDFRFHDLRHYLASLPSPAVPT